jgi:signal transduction histidine kinase
MPVQPFSGTDMAAMVLGVLAALYAALWIRDREHGMAWLALSFALASAWYAASELHMPTGPRIEQGQFGWALVILSASMTMTIGVMQYLGPLTRPRRLVLGVLLLPGVLLFALFVLSVPVLRWAANGAALLGYLGTSAMAFRTARSEPGAGHGFIGTALLAIPGCFILLLSMHAEIRLLRYWGVLPVLFFGLTLLTVSLLRRRRALEWEVERRAIAEKQLTRLNATLEQRVAERTADLQQLVGGLESFNRSVSHDLRGPLGGIEGLAQLALDGLAQGDATVAQRALPAIAAQAQTSHRLVDALLQLARVSDATLRRASVDLAALVQEVVGELSQATPGDGLPAIEVGALPAARGDADLLRPVLRNLIGNAIKFSRETPDAKVTIHGSTTTEEVVVSVRDNGVGFEPQAASRLFQPFRRLHEGRFEGSGVGLSIVRRAVERHGGRVWAESEPGQGAAFYFSLPR